MTGDCTVRVRFHRPPERLSRYFTTFYLTEIDVPSGGRVTDRLHPEWANLRVYSGDLPDSELPGQPPFGGAAANFTGPTSTTLRFTVGTSRIWGIGFLPLGWARFLKVQANLHADHIYAVESAPFLSGFRPLADSIFGEAVDEAAELQRIIDFFNHALERSDEEDPRILPAHAALMNADVSSVSEMAEAAHLPGHTLERICRRYFGFTPRLLLRRQRFMRSLTQYMLDPTLKWVGAMDGHYHDQAQFVREFRAFMGMTPRHYASLDHPILSAIMLARARFAGKAVQTLDGPGGAAA